MTVHDDMTWHDMTLYRTTRTNTYTNNKITTICNMPRILPKQQGEREGPTEDD